jgi:hypothetical protein
MAEAGIRWTEFANLHDQVGHFAKKGADVAGGQNGSPDSSPHQCGNGRIRADEGVDDACELLQCIEKGNEP